MLPLATNCPHHYHIQVQSLVAKHIQHLAIVVAQYILYLLSVSSLVPRRGEGGGEKEHLVSTVCACVLISKNSWKTISLAGISVTLTSVRLLTFTVWRCIPQPRCMNDDKGAMKALSFSVARMIHAFVHSS